MGGLEGSFSTLLKPLQRVIKERGFSSPTEPQEKAIPLILKGENVLLIAPTATGKTEAAILPILHNFLLMPERPQGVKILYITPLRALNRDLMERLEWWCKKLDLTVGVRHGDTDTGERSHQARSPPDMLITTPETLQAILPGKVMRRHLSRVRWVIVDEVHELACDKRGSQLSLGLERLRRLGAGDFQVIGLSATIGSPEKVAKFLVGTRRSCQIVRVPVAKDIRLQIVSAKPSRTDHVTAAKLYTHPEVAARLRVIRDLIEKHSSVLLFTNTRAVAEVLASRFKVWDVDYPVSIHHGSLAKPSRIWAEQGLKGGKLKGLVCTSSLELGIDIGLIDLVIQYNSPRQVTRLVQRVGRSGHRRGGTAKGVIITIDSDDTLEALVIARRALSEELEPVAMPEKPYDTLVQQLAGLLIERKRWHYAEVLELCREAYPYRKLTSQDLDKVLGYMHSRYPRLAWVSSEDQSFLRPQKTKHLYEYYFGNLSMIPDEKHYLVIDQSSDTPVGILDEAFVAEYGDPGTKFIVRGSAWKIVSVYGDKIYAKPVQDPTGAIPSWVGEEIPVPLEVALEVGAIRRFVEESLKASKTPTEVVQALRERYPADAETLGDAVREVVEQVEGGYPVPTDRRVVVEEWGDYLILQCCFGSLVNKTLARILGHVLSEETGEAVGMQEDPYRLVLQAKGSVDGPRLKELLLSLTGRNPGKLAVEAAVKTGLFKRRLIHVARKFGAISKWADFTELSLRQLVKSFEGTAIFEEALKDTTSTDMDIDNTVRILEKIREGSIEVEVVRGLKKPTPIARIGVQRISRKTDLIPPEKMRGILIESTRARLLNEAAVLVCTQCWNYVKLVRIKSLPRSLACPHCGSTRIGLLKEPEKEVFKIAEKKGKNLRGREEGILEAALESADLISKFGFPAAVALVGHGLEAEDARTVLEDESRLTDRFYELVAEAEKKALRRKFW
ncbi:DEAD/DEAH box helicase [Candidatus Hecatella orcuttiae]|jgi:ATP-dependent Lhr-like helicase|uniref:DEAD/DEAH box helicase n=1 Tax=Candidatus Hecatella orcuttiae TaxID=1935119 RepID=UPI002867B2F1|nr:DEAD/DEAH box helicase [Candidatus Hecatella orcuttiae]